MRILDHPSPNHDARPGGVDMLILHYTGMISGEEALVRAEQKRSMREHINIKKNSTADDTDYSDGER